MEKKSEAKSKSIEPIPLNGWDAEEDHLLSYFLSDSQGGNHSQNNLPGPAAQYASSSESGSSSTEPQTPATPAVQFYVHSSKGGKPGATPSTVISASSSGSSLSSLNASKMPGAPVMPQPAQHHVHFHPATHLPAPQQPQPQPGYPYPQPMSLSNDMTTSPISPAAMIGNNAENLMLPPPARHGDAMDTEQQQQAHLTWLQQINTVAMMANRNVVVPPPAYHYSIAQAAPPSTHVESEEKRARRLARNRESARNSRRRKKERLQTLAREVNQLQDQLEIARREKLNEMNVALKEKRVEGIAQLRDGMADDDGNVQEHLRELLQETGPNSITKQSVLPFQYASLKQLLLPSYQEFILWLLRQEESFYTAGKEKKVKSEPTRTSSGRISSKQVGEDVTNSWNSGEGDDIVPVTDGVEEKNAIRCLGSDALKMWPLFCYELQVSVDQEERLLQFYRKSQENSTLEEERIRMQDGARMTVNMRKGLAFQNHAVGMRGENTLLQTLSTEQCLRYLTWFEENKERCRQKLQERQKRETDTLRDARDLTDICKWLDEALRLPGSEVKAEATT